MKFKKLLGILAFEGGWPFRVISVVVSIAGLIALWPEVKTPIDTYKLVGLIAFGILGLQGLAALLYVVLFTEKEAPLKLGIAGTKYDFKPMMSAARTEIIFIGQNLKGLVFHSEFEASVRSTLARAKAPRIYLLFTTPRAMHAIAGHAATQDLLLSIEKVQSIQAELPADQRKDLAFGFHEGASSLSLTMIDPEAVHGLAVLNIKFSVDQEPGNRICSIVERWKHADVFNKVYGGIRWMRDKAGKDVKAVRRELENMLKDA